ncbi:MAG: oligosaccharide flippase family protein [Candidatus Moraniibacteriota bacterium]|jgi:O-antigen/teichoic acid export membrane protein
MNVIIIKNLQKIGIELQNEKIVNDLILSFLGISIASGIMFFVNIFIGRQLGVEQYGIVSIVIIAAQALRTVVTSGLDVAIAKKLASDAKKHKEYISSAVFAILVSICLYSILFFVIFNFAILDEIMVALIFLLSISVGLRLFFDGISRGLFLFKQQVFFRILDAILILVMSFLLFFVTESLTAISFIEAMIISGFFISICFLVILRKKINIKYIRINYIKKLLKLGFLFVVVAILTTVFVLVDKMFIKRYMGLDALGLYSAYYTSSIVISGFLSMILHNVFFVYTSGHKNKASIAKRIDHILKIGFIPIMFFLFACVSVAIVLYGSSFVYNIIYAILFALFGTVVFASSLYWPVIATYSNRIFLKGIISLFVRVILMMSYLGLMVYLDIFSIEVLLIGLIINYSIGIVWLRYIIKKFVK